MKSMTAYVQLEKTIDQTPVSFELKSYNSRYLDIKIKVPFALSSLEHFIREYFSQKIFRGSVEISLSIKGNFAEKKFSVDTNIAKKYYEILNALAKDLNVEYTPSFEYIVSQPGVITMLENADLEKWKHELIPLFDLAIYSFDESKKAEGEICQENIEKNLLLIEQAVTFIETERPNIEANYVKSLKEKFNELVNDEYDQMYVLQEVAVMVNKYTIEEELVRLRAHISAMNENIQKEGAVSKRLDFICQEINREINTIASKNQSYKIAQKVIIVKEAIENIREQLRNLE